MSGKSDKNGKESVSSSSSASASASATPTTNNSATMTTTITTTKKKWSLDQERAIRQFLIRGKNIFLSGEGGTGKSTLVHHLIAVLKTKWSKDELAVGVTATSSQAALNLKGMTIHAWAGLKICKESAETIHKNIIQRHLTAIKKSRHNNKRHQAEQDEPKEEGYDELKLDGFLTKKKSTVYSRIKRAKVLIIDEISTFSGNNINLLDQVLRLVRNNSEVPFGGIQMLFSGDFAQLPPVEPEISENTMSDYAFLYREWNHAIQSTILLRTVFRQKDQSFVELLKRMRSCQMTKEDHKKMETRILRCEKEIPLDEFKFPILQLHPKRYRVSEINQTTLAQLPTRQHTFVLEQRYTNQGKSLTDFKRFPEYAKKLVNDLTKQYNFQEELELKVGASVMLTTNLIQKHPQLCNSLRGYIVAISPTLEESDFFKLGPSVSSVSSSASASATTTTTTRDEEKTPIYIFPDWNTRLQKLLLQKNKDNNDDKQEQKEQLVWIKFSGIDELMGMDMHRVAEPLLAEEKQLEPAFWTSYVSVFQYPFMLAWAATIHKVQGCEYETLYVHFKEYMQINQTYTAISRVRDFEQLFINYWDEKLVRVDPTVVKQIAKWIKLQPSLEEMQKFFSEKPTPPEYL